jgi:hypothetical protein
LTFFIDRDLGQAVPKALQLVRSDIVYLEEEFAHDTPDEVWLEVMGQRGWTVITRNRKISTNPTQAEAIRSHGVRCFCLMQKKPLTRWQMLERLVKSWDAMEQQLDVRPAPFMLGILSAGAFKQLV